MIRLKIKNHNKVSTEKQQEYQLHHQVKLINIQVKKYHLLIKGE